MPRYADTLLTSGERIVVRSRQHWLATIIDARYPWLILAAAIVVLLFSQNLGPGIARDLVGYLVLVALVIAIAWLMRVYWNWWAQDYIVTNRRVLKVEGIINKRSADSSLEKINDAVLEQNLVGRLLNYGDLDILTASEEAIDHYRMLDAAPAFKREMLHQKHELEGEFVRPVAPPLRARPPAPPEPLPAGAGPHHGAAASMYSDGHPAAAPIPSSAGDPVPSAAATPPSAASAGPAPMSPEEVTRTLAGLADLRDRGAITDAEYDQKKSELLARL